MNKEVTPNFTSAVLLGCAVLVLGVLAAAPVHIEIKPNTVAAQETPTVSQSQTVADALPSQVVEYTLRTQVGGTPAMAFVGVGGTIEGLVNPELKAQVGDTIRLTLINGDAVQHNLQIDEFKVFAGDLMKDEETVTVEFVVTKPGQFKYYCAVPGHQQIGMEGKLTVEGTAQVAEASTGEAAAEPEPTTAPAAADAVSIVRNPADLPPPLPARDPMTVVVNMTAVETNGLLADGTTYHYMTFDGKVPGPMIRVLVGDTVEVHLKNDPTSTLQHSIDLHSVTGPGGGAVYTQTLPGDDTGFTFKALQPGLYVYHCATPSIGHHISSGMYGLVLVEPVGGLPPVDHEFYIMQGEIYTTQPFGTPGHLDFSHDKMLDEDPEYYVFNGAAGALTTDENALHVKVGDTVRVYFGVGGPNAISSFHLIGEIFDKVYDQASLTAPALTDVQTTLVPPGGATVVEFTINVPGRYILVDHALSRLERGLAGYLYADGADDPSIFQSEGEMDSAGH